MISSVFAGFLLFAAQVGDASAQEGAPAASSSVMASSSSAAATSSMSLPFDPQKGPDKQQVLQLPAFMKQAVKDKDWFLFAGLLLFVLMFMMRNVVLPVFGVADPALYDLWLPRISAVLTALPALAIALVDPSVDIGSLVSTAAGCFVTAEGLWRVSKSTLQKLPKMPVSGAADAAPAPVDSKKE